MFILLKNTTHVNFYGRYHDFENVDKREKEY